MYSRIEGTSALKSTQPRALTVLTPHTQAGTSNSGVAPRVRRSHKELLFDDERCYEYGSVDLKAACGGPIKLALVYASALLFMVAGLALATVL